MSFIFEPQSPSLFLQLMLLIFIVGISLFLAFLFWPKKGILVQKRTPWLPEDQYIEIEGFNIRYIQAGTGPDLVLLHGIGASIFIWRFLLHPLSKKFRVTALDLPGFGLSSKIPEKDYGLDSQTRRLHLFLLALNIKKMHFAGSSMGGALALWYGRVYPKETLSVFAMAPATHSELARFISPELKKLSTFLSITLLTPLKNNILKRVLHDHSLITPESTTKYFEPYKNSPQAISTFFSAIDLIKDKRLPAELIKLNCPTFIYWGGCDKMVKEVFMTDLNRILPNSTLFIDPQSGHHPMEDNPSLVFKKLVHFMEKESSKA